MTEKKIHGEPPIQIEEVIEPATLDYICGLFEDVSVSVTIYWRIRGHGNYSPIVIAHIFGLSEKVSLSTYQYKEIYNTLVKLLQKHKRRASNFLIQIRAGMRLFKCDDDTGLMYEHQENIKVGIGSEFENQDKVEKNLEALDIGSEEQQADYSEYMHENINFSYDVSKGLICYSEGYYPISQFPEDFKDDCDSEE